MHNQYPYIVRYGIKYCKDTITFDVYSLGIIVGVLMLWRLVLVIAVIPEMHKDADYILVK